MVVHAPFFRQEGRGWFFAKRPRARSRRASFRAPSTRFHAVKVVRRRRRRGAPVTIAGTVAAAGVRWWFLICSYGRTRHTYPSIDAREAFCRPARLEVAVDGGGFLVEVYANENRSVVVAAAALESESVETVAAVTRKGRFGCGELPFSLTRCLGGGLPLAEYLYIGAYRLACRPI